MKLNDLRDNVGARKSASPSAVVSALTKGKTCGRGVKGQKARTGVNLGGFERPDATHPPSAEARLRQHLLEGIQRVINLGRLQKAIDEGRLDAKQPINEDAIVKAGLVPSARDGVRVLGDGEIKAKVQLSVAGASKSAIAAVEKAGGKLTVIVPRVPANVVKDQARKVARDAAKAKAFQKAFLKN